MIDVHLIVHSFDSAPSSFRVRTHDRLAEERPFSSIHPASDKHMPTGARVHFYHPSRWHNTPSCLPIRGSSPSKVTGRVELCVHVPLLLSPSAYGTNCQSAPHQIHFSRASTRGLYLLVHHGLLAGPFSDLQVLDTPTFE